MEFVVTIPMVISTDSSGAIGIANFKQVNNRTKHINVRYHFVRERTADGTIVLQKVKTSDNTADMFTKNLGKVVLTRLLAKTSLELGV